MSYYSKARAVIDVPDQSEEEDLNWRQCIAFERDLDYPEVIVLFEALELSLVNLESSYDLAVEKSKCFNLVGDLIKLLPYQRQTHLGERDSKERFRLNLEGLTL